MDRRTTIQWMLAAAASTRLLGKVALADIPSATPMRGRGYGTDPDLTRVYKPGELWPLTFTLEQRQTATALSDLIIPHDAHSPSASAVGVIDFLDEWVSAPYPEQAADRKVILEGFAWLDKEAQRRFKTNFSQLDEAGMRSICDEICYVPRAKPEFRRAAEFFARYRDLTADGFYTSPQGRSDLRFIGNVPRERFDGPPPEVLKRVGLA
jgi:hypothetical protein